MGFFNRLGAILFTVFMAVQISDVSPISYQQLTKQQHAFYQSGLDLYSEGCGDIGRGQLKDKSKCVLALTRLKHIVEINPELLDGQLRLAEIYYFQPAQMNWGEDTMVVRTANLKLGMKHLRKAIELQGINPQSESLLEKYKTVLRESQTAGRKNGRTDAL